MSAKMNSKQLIDFIQTYLSVIRRYCSVLPLSRRSSFPDFWFSRYQILAYACEDSIAIEFKRKIGKKIDSVTVMSARERFSVCSSLCCAVVVVFFCFALRAEV
jgi:hypothetical protein